MKNYAEAFTALKSKQGDALTTDDAILYGMADEDPSYELVGKAVHRRALWHCCEKGNKELVDALNDALKKIKDSGKYDEIHDKWIKQ